MKLLDWLLEKLGFEDDDEDFGIEFPELDAGGVRSITEAVKGESLLRRDLNVHNPIELEQYIRRICEMMSVSSSDVDIKKGDYQRVTDKLQDMEEIEALPAADKFELKRRAVAILEFEERESKYKRPVSKISESKYREYAQMEDELPEIIKTLKENEEYQMLVRRDMNLLEGEKAGLAFDRKENRKKLANSRGYFVVSTVAALLALLVVYALSGLFYFNPKFPIVVITSILAICYTGIYVSYRDAADSIKKLNRQINRAISLQNTAKVKYVNITNAIDYRYSKYDINSSHELLYNYEKYLEEKEARHHTENAVIQLEQLRNALSVEISRFRIKEPAQFVYQPALLVYEEQMAARRHELVIERQKIRKGMDFEVYNLDAYKDEIENLVKQYPQYSQDILKIVQEYE